MTTSICRFAAIVAGLMVAVGCASASPAAAPTTSPAAAATPSAFATPTPASVTLSAAPTVAATTARPTATPAPTTFSTVEWTELSPTAEIDVPGSGVIATATDGETIWAVAPNALLKVNPETVEVESMDAPVMSDDTSLALADDGLWVARWAGGKLYLLNPKTGDVRLDADLETAVNLQFLGDDLWVGQENLHSMFKVDRSTADVDSQTQLVGTAYAQSGMGYLWFMDGSQVKRIDPQTKEVEAVLDLAGQSNCARGFGGKFPDAVWTSCLEREVAERSVVRIDPVAGSVAAVAMTPPSHGGGVITIGDHTWFVGNFEDADHNHFAGLVRIDPQTGEMDRFFSIADADPDAAFVAGDALWIADEAGHRLVKIDLADLET